MKESKIEREVLERIAYRAVQIAQRYGERRKWRSTETLLPFVKDGQVGMYSPVKHLKYQDRGTKPRVMYELEGKVIPLPDGPRLAKDVGKPGWVTLPGGVKKWRDQKWRHPGIKPTNFMRRSIIEAVEIEKRNVVLKSVKGAVEKAEQRRGGLR